MFTSSVATSVALLLGGAVPLRLFKRGTTRPIVEASISSLRQALQEAEELVTHVIPGNSEARELVREARRCLNFASERAMEIVGLTEVQRTLDIGLDRAQGAISLAYAIHQQ